MQCLAIPAVIGLSAVQEFVIRGGGTPVPYDPPKRLVTTGIYAYVRNPMQLSAVLLLCLLGLALQNFWLAGAGIMAHIYSAGLAGWDEDDDLHKRFGSAWTTYRRGVRAWWPRVRPWRRDDRDDLPLRRGELWHVQRGGPLVSTPRRARPRDCSRRNASVSRADADHLRIERRRLHGLGHRSRRASARARAHRMGVHRLCPSAPGRTTIHPAARRRLWRWTAQDRSAARIHSTDL